MRKFLAGIRFRTSTPTFEEGEEMSAFVTGHDGGTPLIRVGDSVLYLPGESVDPDTRVRIRVTRFDASTHEGEADLLGVEGDGAF
ncbi:DUF7513 family protein [Halomarina litorea]|uniref:DUF7513 family protein n=1 Tax=Halomarina litorea TaxID=2961595 RepID=UPI0020C310CF|nr:hypothetical protein [Halomarina sp. BCD28]